MEVLEPVGLLTLIHEVAGHAAVEKRLRETMTGKEAAQLEASKSSVPVSRKSGDVQEHSDHINTWVNSKVPGTAAVAYLESAPDGSSLGKLIFKDVASEGSQGGGSNRQALHFLGQQQVLAQLQSTLPRPAAFARSSCTDFL